MAGNRFIVSEFLILGTKEICARLCGASGLLCEDGKLPMLAGATTYDRRWDCTLRRLHEFEYRV